MRHEQVMQIARQMMTAARTAPKGKGVDVIEIAIITDEDIKRLSDEMVAIHEENGFKFFLRDADNILNAECILLIGTREHAHGLNCGHCGYCHRFGLCYSCRSSGRYPCDVLRRFGGPAIGNLEWMQTSVCHSGKRFFEESVLRQKAERTTKIIVEKLDRAF